MKAYDCWIDGEGSHTAQRVEVHDAMGDGPQRAAEQFVRWREADAHRYPVAGGNEEVDVVVRSVARPSLVWHFTVKGDSSPHYFVEQRLLVVNR